MTFYRRNLPHWQPNGAKFFITFGLAGSLPKSALEKIKQERVILERLTSQDENNDSLTYRRIKYQKIFQKYEHLLHGNTSGPTWLSDPEIAAIIKESIHYRDEKDYILYSYCIMHNHVHLVFQHISNKIKEVKDVYPITDILASLKKYTARLCNQKLKRSGIPFWHPESYDRVIRDSDELQRVIHYTLYNPVKAGFVEKWTDWPNSYCKKDFIDLF